MIKECKKCGKEFKAHRKSQICCSISCSNSIRELKENRENKKNICEICGKEFLSTHKKSRFCSSKCNRKNRYIEENEIMIDYTCENCGVSFQRSKSYNKQDYCSNSCSRLAMHKNMTEEQKKGWKEKISIGNTGNFFTEERKQQYIKMFSGKGNPRYGARLEKKQKEKISASVTKRYLDGTLTGYSNRNNHKVGFYFSTKMNKNLHYRSSWELSAYEHIDKNENVKFYFVEPFSIPYLFEGVQKNYIPDILIEYKDGTKKLIEIKPKQFLDNDINQSKFIAAQQFCQQNDISFFETWTEDKILSF